MEVATRKFLFLILHLGLLSACSRDVETAKIRIETPVLAASSSPPNAQNGPSWSGSFTSSSEVNCFGVFVGAPEPGMDHSSCSEKGTSTELMRFGPYAAGVPAGGVIELDVPSGPLRHIALVAMKATAGSCVDFHGSGPPSGQIAHPRLVGVQILNLEPGDQDLAFVLPGDLSAKKEIDECDVQDQPNIGGGSGLALNVDQFHIADRSDTGFQVFQQFSGDSNSNATVDVKYCNSPCNPFTAGTAISMNRLNSLGLFNGEDTSAGTAGQLLDIGVEFNDPDGVNGPLQMSFKHKLVKEVVRSVGPGETSPLVTGGGSGLTFSLGGSVAVFSGGLPSNVGVGDVLEYDSNNDGTLDAVGFLSFRINAENWVVRSTTGIAPTAATSGTEADWAICRAYTSLAAWESQTENVCISSPNRDFDNITEPVNIKNGGQHQTWKIYLYPGTTADTATVVVSDWQTEPGYELHFKTPRSEFEAGTDFGHAGVFNNSSVYRLQVTGNDALRFSNQAKNVIIDGLQVSTTSSTAAFHRGIRIDIGAGGTPEYKIENSIIFATNPTNAKGPGIAVAAGAGLPVLKAFNNVIYDFQAPGGFGISLANTSAASFIYNNTIVGNDEGINVSGSQPHELRNNLVANSITADYGGTLGSILGSTNISTDSTAIGSGKIPNATIAFANPASKDFRLIATDAAVDAGTDLSSDPNIPFDFDIRFNKRGTLWDIGAFEF